MILRKREYPQRKIRSNLLRRMTDRCTARGLSKSQGQIQWVMGLFFIVFFSVLLCAQLQLELYRSAAWYLEDALAASNLASAVIDIEEYGKSHKILIADYREAYERFCVAVQGNLHLDEQWQGNNKNLIAGTVTVEKYAVYNVNDEEVEVYVVNSRGEEILWEGALGAVSAPNGIPIESTSVYSEISFPVEGVFGSTVIAHKGKLVDIVKQEDDGRPE